MHACSLDQLSFVIEVNIFCFCFGEKGLLKNKYYCDAYAPVPCGLWQTQEMGMSKISYYLYLLKLSVYELMLNNVN